MCVSVKVLPNVNIFIYKTIICIPICIHIIPIMYTLFYIISYITKSMIN